MLETLEMIMWALVTMTNGTILTMFLLGFLDNLEYGTKKKVGVIIFSGVLDIILLSLTIYLGLAIKETGLNGYTGEIIILSFSAGIKCILCGFILRATNTNKIKEYSKSKGL